MNRKSIIALILVIATVMSLLAGCGGGGKSQVDSTKTHLSVLNYDGGIGDQWLKHAAKRSPKAISITT